LREKAQRMKSLVRGMHRCQLNNASNSKLFSKLLENWFRLSRRKKSLISAC